MDQNALYRGQRLTLARFWATGEPCLWITDSEQIGCPKWNLWEATRTNTAFS